MVRELSRSRVRLLVAAAAAAGALVLPSAALAAPRTFTANKVADTPPNGCTKSDCTLREAVIAANGHPGPDTVVALAGKTYALAIPGADEQAGATGDLDVTGPTTIRSSKRKGRPTINGGGIDRILDIRAPSTLNGLILTGGSAAVAESGGAVLATKNLVVRRTLITANSADGSGSGIALFGNGSLSMRGSTVTQNTHLGILGASSGKVTIESSKLTLNALGAIIETGGASVSITDSDVSDNHGNGVLEQNGGSVSARHSTFDRNFSSGISVSDGNLTATSSHLDSNSNSGATQSGPGNIVLTGSTASHNTANGLLESDAGAVKLVKSRAVGNGGSGVAANGPGRSRFDQSTFTGNQEGAIQALGGEEANITRSTLADNQSTFSGAGVLVTGGTLTMVNDTVDGNKSYYEGGGIAAFNETTASLNAVTVVRNEADIFAIGNPDGGGVFQTDGAQFTVSNSLIALNTIGHSTFEGPDCFNGDVPFISGGHNLIGDPSGCDGFGPATQDIFNSDPKIGQLKSNGGPTQTVALGGASPARNRGGSSAPARDQRGFKRAGKPDIGAFEFHPKR